MKERNTSDEKSNNKAVAMRGILIALALMLSYLESFIPTYIILPGVKLGLANIVTVYALYEFGLKDTFFICIARVVLSTLLFGNVLTLVYSLAGILLSVVAMQFAKLLGLSIVTVSITGAVFHNLGQCLVAALILRNAHVFYYFGFVMIIAFLTGLIIGLTAREVIKRVRELGGTYD